MASIAQARFPTTARFELIRPIGSGGMGVVYEVFDRERNTRVALKTLISLTLESLQRFKNEFRSLQDLRHPNLIALDELIEVDSTWFFTMTLVDGVDLLEHVRPADAADRLDPEALQRALDARGPQREPSVEQTIDTEDSAWSAAVADRAPRSGFDEGRLRGAFRQLALGLSALHAAGKVHRDVKPANVMVTGDGQVVILDFGLVSELGQRDSRLVGTVAYMAPEQASVGTVGPPADWYAVGVTLYRALTGSFPHTGSADEVILAKLGDATPPSPASLVPGIPADLDALCMDLLRRRPEDRPSSGEVLERLGAAATPTATLAAPLVGRARELALLEDALAASATEGVAVLVHGESGVGKSALVRELLERIGQRRAALLLPARCYERETVPYKAVDQVMEALARHLAGLPADDAAALLPAQMAQVAGTFPVFLQVPSVAAAMQVASIGRAADPFGQRSAMFRAVRELFSRHAARGQLVVAIDDLQWADQDSLALLAELMAAPAPPLLLCATVRATDETAPAVLDALSARLGATVRRLPVTELAPEAARELIERLVRSAGDAGGSIRAADLAGEAGGHPMLIDALVRHRLQHPDDAVPGRLDDAILARTDDLEPTARRVLSFLCVAGGPIQQEACAHAAGTPFGEFAAVLSTLRAANLARTHGVRRADTAEPYHDRVREAVAARLAADERRDIHARLARALEASDEPDPETLAVHLREAGDDRRAARYAARAAERALEALAFDRASRLYRMALALDPSSPTAARLRIRLAESLGLAGQARDAAAVYAAAAAEASGAEVVELHRLAADQYLRSGRIGEGLDALAAVLATVGMKLPTSRGQALRTFVWERLRLKMRGLDFQRRDERDVPPELIRKIEVCFTMFPFGMTDTLRGHPFQMRNLRFSLDAGVPARIVRAIAPEIVFACTLGERKSAYADQIVEFAEQLAADVGDPYLSGAITAATCAGHSILGRFRSCRDRGDAAVRTFREQCVGVAWELDTALLYSTRGRFFLGEIAEIRQRLPSALKEARDHGDLYLSTNLEIGFPMAHLCLADDDAETGRRLAANAMAAWGYEGTHLQHVADLQGMVSCDLYDGDAAAALRRMDEWWPRIAKAMYLRIELTRLVTTHLRARIHLTAATQAQGPARARHLDAAAADARAILKERVSWATPLGVLLEAGVAAGRGDATTSAARLETAADGLQHADLNLFAAAARRQHGRLLGGSEGAALVAGADRWMTGQTIRSPGRFADLLAPGFI